MELITNQANQTTRNEQTENYGITSRFLTGFKLGLRDGQLEVEGKLAPPGALKLAAKRGLYGAAYIYGRQHALSRAGMSGGTLAPTGPLESTVTALKSLIPGHKENQSAPLGWDLSKLQLDGYHLRPIEVAQLYSCIGPATVETEAKAPAGTYVCPECRSVTIIWRTPVDKYKIKCPKCSTEMVLDKPKVVASAVETDRVALFRNLSIGKPREMMQLATDTGIRFEAPKTETPQEYEIPKSLLRKLASLKRFVTGELSQRKLRSLNKRIVAGNRHLRSGFAVSPTTMRGESARLLKAVRHMPGLKKQRQVARTAYTGAGLIGADTLRRIVQTKKDN